MNKGVAPIKAQYLLHVKKETGVDTPSSEPTVAVNDTGTEDKIPKSESNQAAQDLTSSELSEPQTGKRVIDESDKSEHTNQKKRRRGQNKQREKFSNKRAAPADRLCKAITTGIVCEYGDACKFSHNVTDYMTKKPSDIGPVCYNFKQLGRCPYGFTCRYAQSHLTQVEGEYKNMVDENVVPTSKSVNGMDRDVKVKLTRKKYDFARADKCFKEAQNFVSKIVKQNVELNCTKKSKGHQQDTRDIQKDQMSQSVPENTADSEGNKEQESVVNDSAASESATELEAGSQLPPGSVCTESTNGSQLNPDTANGNSSATDPTSETEKPVGPITNEDQFAIKPAEKKPIDFKNKLYLAPLTTVGNLPFRRICKTYGADITCGEMALATKLLQGVNSEWALMKRHSSEDLFGVQVAGAFPDSMARCAQLLSETCDLDFIDINVGCPIDLIFDMGAGSALMRRINRFHEIVRSMVTVSTVPITVKIRTGVSESKSTAHTLIPKLKMWDVALCTLHGRSREQRYTKSADWGYIDDCAKIANPLPFFGGGDILSFEDYNAAMQTDVSGVMIARGALIKPWVFTEIKEQRHWDISSAERLDILRDFSNYGLEHWGSDQQGVETTRRFMLEWLSFLHRYIPVGLLERLPQKINERPSPYFGRDDLETLMASPNSADWVKISEMLLGPVPEGFFFIPKHKASSYSN